MKLKKNNPFNNLKLDPIEQEIEDAVDKNKIVSVGNIDKERDKLALYAQYTKELIKKNKRISLRIAEKDLKKIKAKAIENGVGYQTLITIILNKYARGKLQINL